MGSSLLLIVNWDLIDHFGFNWSSLNAYGRLDIDQVRPALRDMQSIELVDQIYPNHPDPGKKILDVLKVYFTNAYTCLG